MTKNCITLAHGTGSPKVFPLSNITVPRYDIGISTILKDAILCDINFPGGTGC